MKTIKVKFSVPDYEFDLDVSGYGGIVDREDVGVLLQQLVACHMANVSWDLVKINEESINSACSIYGVVNE